MANTNQGGRGSQGDSNRDQNLNRDRNVERGSSEKDNVKRNPSMNDEDLDITSEKGKSSDELKRDKSGSIGNSGRDQGSQGNLGNRK